jgi:hypothetical protein
VDVLIGRHAHRQRLVEATAGYKAKAFAKQGDPLTFGSNRQSWSGRHAELRKAAPLLLIADKTAAQIGIKRVDRLDQVQRSTRVPGEADIIELRVSPANVDGYLGVDVNHVDTLLHGRRQSHRLDGQRLRCNRRRDETECEQS